MLKISVTGIAEKNKKYFIAQRKPGNNFGNKWEFPGGKVEDNESPEQALIREFREEFNVEIEIKKLFLKTNFFSNNKEYDLNAFFIVLKDQEIKLSEHTDYKWASISEIDALDFMDSDKKILQEIRKLEK